MRGAARLAGLAMIAALASSCGGGGGGGGGGGNGGGGGGGPTAPPPDPGGPSVQFTDLAQQAGGRVRACVPANDGSGDVYAGGAFRTYHGTLTSGIVRLNADGTVDPAFAVGQGFAPPVGAVEDETFGVHAIAPAVDGTGDVYVGGSFALYGGAPVNTLVRLNADGTLDAAFVPALDGAPQLVERVLPAVDGSGDVYVIRIAQLVRLNADGTADGGFATGTGFSTGTSLPARPADLAFANDGSGALVVVGSFASYNGTPANDALRLNADGTIDATFAAGTAFAGAGSPTCLAVAADGDVYVGGTFNAGQGAATNRILRLNADGTVDAAFAVGVGFNLTVEDVLIDGSGLIWVAGQFTGYDGVASLRLACLNVAGLRALDVFTGFGAAGAITLDLAQAPDGSGNVYVAGSFGAYDGIGANGIVRITANGNTDLTFATGARLDMCGWFQRCQVFAIAPAINGTGDMYLAGQISAYSGVSTMGIVRVNPNGTRDAAFNVGAGFAGNLGVGALAVGADGDVYVGGQFTSYNGVPAPGLVRLNPDGSIDPNFAAPGISAAVRSIARVGGTSPDFYVGFNDMFVRMSPTGAVSGAFAPLAVDVTSIAPAIDGSGDVYIGGEFSTGIMRLNSNGTLEGAFDRGDGFVDALNFAPLVRAIVPAADGSGDIYVGGRWTSYDSSVASPLVRLNADGSLDASFDVRPFGLPINTSPATWDGVTALTLAPGGDLYVAGGFSMYDGVPANRLMRLNPNGSRDASFATGAGFAQSPLALAMVPGGSGDVYAAGGFGHYNTTTAVGIVKLNADGSVD